METAPAPQVLKLELADMEMVHSLALEHEERMSKVHAVLRQKGADMRWLSIAWTDLQTSHMALIRAVTEKVE